jgi:uncharacterized protein (TIGR03083 family)
MSEVPQAWVGEQLQRLHDALATLSEEDWRRPSLCEGWTLRHVIAHLTMASRYSPEAFGQELAADGFDFGTMSDRLAERDSARSPQELLGDLVTDQLARHTTPQGGVIGALSHAVIHGLDATVPAGLGSTASDEALAAVLDNLTTGGVHAHFGTSLDGLESEDLPDHVAILRLTGRKLPTR